MAEEKENVGVKVITPEQAEKLGPQEIVMNNARVLVRSDLKTTKEFINKSMDYMSSLINPEEKPEHDFRTDPKDLIGIQLQLASLSLAAEYWLSKIKKERIKVYSPADMPKA